MKELHALVDYENVQPTLDELGKLAPGFTDVWLFHGPHQIQRAAQFAEDRARVTTVPRSGAGPNALDFHLSFYLGYVAAKHPDARLVIVANDKGYDPMIAHANLLGFTAMRVGYKAKPAPVAKAASAKKAVTATVPTPAKKVVTPAASAKAVAKKAAVTRVRAVRAATSKAPAKKAAAKKIAPQRAAAKKVTVKPSAKNSPAPNQTKPAAAKVAMATSPDPKTLARIQKGLTKMGNNAPHKLMPFLRHVGALLGKGSSAEQIDAVVAKLEAAGVVRVAGDLVLYSV